MLRPRRKKIKDHTKLLCDINELSDLFEDTTSLEMFLQKIVYLISEHMCSEVCSIYLFYEERKELVLKATKGLSAGSVNKVQLKLGEGLTGLSVKEMRPICVRQASQDRHYKYFPGIGEERYESFLAVPILRAQKRIGAVVVQNVLKNYFNKSDERVLSAITAQLASIIETAKILMTLHAGSRTEPKSQFTLEDLKIIKGAVGSKGIVYAPVTVWGAEDWQLRVQKALAASRHTMDHFKKAVRKAEMELISLQEDMDKKYSDVAAFIFNAQLLMLKDQEFIEAMVRLIRGGMDPARAVLKVVKSYVGEFDKIPDPHIRERRLDVLDVGRRLLFCLTGESDKGEEHQGHVVISRDLFPSDIIKLASQGVKGIILLTGGVTSHLAILSRSLRMPLIICDQPELLLLKQGTAVLIDAEVGNVYINPAREVRASFAQREAAKKKTAELYSGGGEVFTVDGERILLLANINLLCDVPVALGLQAEGVGLYRTEFPFLARSQFPSEEEQFIIYKRLIDSMPGKEITFRTLDIGGDKVLSYFHFEKEQNPFLGMRSIRFSLKHKEIFSQQLRAILRAGSGSSVRILFPMISSLDEFLEARSVLNDCQADLRSQDIAICENCQVGLMIELPCVLEMLEELAEAADFLSIGSNDFIQYMLAVDRTNEKVADLFLPQHPAVLRALKRVVQAALKHKKDISVCGDMAHEEEYLLFLIGIGIRKISVDPVFLPRVRKCIRSINSRKARLKSGQLLKQSRIVLIDQLIQKSS